MEKSGREKGACRLYSGQAMPVKLAVRVWCPRRGLVKDGGGGAVLGRGVRGARVLEVCWWLDAAGRSQCSGTSHRGIGIRWLGL
jgi:hypothetical protein